MIAPRRPPLPSSLLVTALLLVVGHGSVALAAKKPGLARVALLPLQPVPGGEDDAWLGAALTELLRLRLGWAAPLALTAGPQRQALLDEQAAQLGFEPDGRAAAATLEALGAGVVVFGRFQKHQSSAKVELRLIQPKARNPVSDLLSVTGTMREAIETAGRAAEKLILVTGLLLPPATVKHLARPATSTPEALQPYGQALLALRAGHYQDALEAASQSIAHDGNFLEARLALAEAFFGLGRLGDTSTTFDDLLGDGLRLLGAGHPFVVAVRTRYGQVLQLFGDRERAYKVLGDALTQARAIYGAEHPETALVANQLATVLTGRGLYNDAASLLTQALLVINRELGPKHPIVADLSSNLGMVHLARKDYPRAVDFTRLAAALAESTLESDDPTLAFRYRSLSLALHARGLHDEALAYAQRALDILDKAYGDRHPLTISTTADLGAIHFSNNDYEQAMHHYRRALKRAEEVFGPDHPLCAEQYANAAGVYLAQGAWEEAERLYRQALAVFTGRGLGDQARFVRRQLNLIAAKRR